VKKITQSVAQHVLSRLAQKLFSMKKVTEMLGPLKAIADPKQSPK
jgi:hypothetical protein